MARKRTTSPTLPYMQLVMYEQGNVILRVDVPNPGPVTANKMAARIGMADGAIPEAVAITLIEVAIALIGEKHPLTNPLIDIVAQLVVSGTDWGDWESKLREAAGDNWPF